MKKILLLALLLSGCAIDPDFNRGMTIGSTNAYLRGISISNYQAFHSNYRR